ncbi:MAG: (2Fe-2S)-binding protein [Tenericutes bacterium]|nr:(2Fe-2S)-binding protein [Mycoplasmatota bacterium]
MMKIIIDNKEIPVNDSKRNIVEIAEDNGITIVAPCFKNKRKGGCCKACIIEIDGAKRYACGTKPTDGMNISYKRADLKELRDLAIQKYVKVLKENISSPCECNCNSNNQFETVGEESSCCGSNCECS